MIARKAQNMIVTVTSKATEEQYIPEARLGCAENLVGQGQDGRYAYDRQRCQSLP